MKISNAYTEKTNSSADYSRVTSRQPQVNGNAASILLRLEDGKDAPVQRLFVPISKGDNVRFVNGSAWVDLRKMKGEIQVTPAWSSKKFLSVNGKEHQLTIKEIESQDELDEYNALTHFHYRGRGGVGRRVPLIAKTYTWNLPKVVGFVELSSSMIVNVARKKILNAPFYDPELGIQWDSWDWETAKKYSNVIVRISRCVVYPELRGLGLAAQLTDAAVEYAKERWHIGGLRPCFMEIIAEMLRYWPFVEKSGFVKVGETQGNEKSVSKAMSYLLNRKVNGKDYPQGGGGIMSMHRTNAEKLAKIQKERGLSIEKIVNLLEKSPDKLSTKDWVSLHEIHRRKKPTYMLGLTPSARKHLKRLTEDHKPNKNESSQKHSEILLSIDNLKIRASVKPSSSVQCRRVQEAFGIVSSKFNTQLVSDLSVELKAGDIVLISGASGVGKSTLLDAIKHLTQRQGRKIGLPKGIRIDCRKVSKKARIVSLQKPPQSKAPIELLSKQSLDDALRILARAGLAEAHLFVRPSYALSLGQSYRLALALALAKKPDVVLIDEFCEPLDEYTTAVVCRKLRQAAKNEGICVIAATAYAHKVLPELKPTRTLLLSSNGRHKWINKQTRSLP